MLVLAMMAGGFSTVELITNNLIPITTRHFTDSALIISIILASNRLFGFVVQPYVCWKSDQVRTKYGRRRPFFLVGLPLTIGFLLAIGLLPRLIEGDARHTLPALILVFIINIAMQAVVDVNWGSLEPLYADTFNQEQLGRAGSFRQIAAQSANFVMVTWVIGWAEIDEIFPYLFAATCVAVSFALMVFVIRERPLEDPPQQERYQPLAHLQLIFRSRDHLKLAFVCGANLAIPAALFLFTPLYVTDTLGLSTAELGLAQVAGPLLTVCLALPLGWTIDYFGPKWVMATGFLLSAIAFTGLCFWAHDFWSLFACLTVFGVAQIVALMPMSAMVFQYADRHERGKLFGIIQFSRAFGAFAISLLLGMAVQWTDSYAPTPFRAQDIKRVSTLADEVADPASPAHAWVADQLTPRTRERLADPDRAEGARQAIADELNRLVFGPAVYDDQRFVDISLSPQSQKLITEAPADGDRLAVLNRSLISDLFPDAVSRKNNYIFPYYLGLVLALVAMVVALSTRRGRFARTLSDSDAPSAA